MRRRISRKCALKKSINCGNCYGFEFVLVQSATIYIFRPDETGNRRFFGIEFEHFPLTELVVWAESTVGASYVSGGGGIVIVKFNWRCFSNDTAALSISTKMLCNLSLFRGN